MRSGNISIDSGRLWYAGIYGYNWSTMASSTLGSGSAVPSAYFLLFNATGVGPSDGPASRWSGFPLRCLASGGGDRYNDYLGHLRGGY